MPVDDELARFQAALLALLAQPISSAAMLDQLRHEAAFKPFQDYLASFEPRMVETAAELVKKWGRRTDAPDSPLDCPE